MARWGWLHRVPMSPPSPNPAARGRGCSKTVMIQCAGCQGTSVRPLIIESNQRPASEMVPTSPPACSKSHTAKCCIVFGWFVRPQRFVCLLPRYNLTTITVATSARVCACASGSGQSIVWNRIIDSLIPNSVPSCPIFSSTHASRLKQSSQLFACATHIDVVMLVLCLHWDNETPRRDKRADSVWGEEVVWDAWVSLGQLLLCMMAEFRLLDKGVGAQALIGGLTERPL